MGDGEKSPAIVLHKCMSNTLGIFKADLHSASIDMNGGIWQALQVVTPAERCMQGQN